MLVSCPGASCPGAPGAGAASPPAGAACPRAGALAPGRMHATGGYALVAGPYDQSMASATLWTCLQTILDDLFDRGALSKREIDDNVWDFMEGASCFSC